MPLFIHRVLRFALRLFLGLFAVAFAVSLLLASLVLVSFGLLRALITGKKPQPMVFSQFQRFSTQPAWPGPVPRKEGVPQAEVVDVEVREIRDDSRP